jgi:nicotinate-nucleotide adenylyltransferase
MNPSLKRVGVFGGTFDPPHIGHLIIAQQAVEQLKLERVLFVPAFLPPHKRKGATARPLQRLVMLRKAISGVPAFAVSSVEIVRGGVSYTVDTLRDIKAASGDARLFLIVGGDNFAQFRKWKSASEIRKLATIVVYERADSRRKTLQHAKGKVIFLRGARLDVSSTLIRDRVKRHVPIRFLVPPAVERFIQDHRLYR